MQAIVFLLLALRLFGLTLAIKPQPRFKHGCVTLQQKIYCYGGGQYVPGGINYNTVLNEHLILDLSKDWSLNDGQSAWEKLSPPANFTLEPNYSFGFAAISNTSYLITSGSGYNNGKAFLKNKTTIYHADIDQWQTVPTNANQTIGSSLDIDQNGNAYLFGGLVTYTNTIPNRNFLTYKATTNGQWLSSPLGPGTIFRTEHASAVDNNGVIYYTGGRLGTLSGSAYTWDTNVPLTTITTYDTKTLTWGSITAKVNGTTPTSRNSHTFTYLPKTNQFVLFGGKQGNSETPGTFDDICYTFDPETTTWTQQNVSSIGSGSRFGHSAVLYMDTYLFIIFGADHVTMSMNNFYMLNVDNWTWLNSFTAGGNPNSNTTTTTNNNNGDDHQNSSSGIGGGAIAGIIIGVVALIAIIAACIFFLRRKKQESVSKPTTTQFEIDGQFTGPPKGTYFSKTTQEFMNATNDKSTPLTRIPSQRSNRIYHPDEMSISTAPTYTSSSPITAQSTTVVANDIPLQNKPDLTGSFSYDQDTVKPYGNY
ncbi:hypothetical protein BC941DRAFT_419047 [Chlamydoabsidia padenii]|nr:hypothetical protein BC941DRAFT_419047 [Chlamydoabsidia padenii]